MTPGICLRRFLAAALCALLSLATTAQPVPAEGPTAMTAILAVAQGDVTDPDFGDSSVLVMNNLAPAPIGIIINRPTSVTVAQVFPALKSLAKLPDKVYFGGPVESDSVWFLFRASNPPSKQAIQVLDGVCLSANRPLLLKLLKREKPLDGLRIFIGHAGWEPGQLEAEIAAGAWKLEHVDADAVFKDQPEHPWPSNPATPQLPEHST
jgi:putative transcriptional regulator